MSTAAAPAPNLSRLTPVQIAGLLLGLAGFIIPWIVQIPGLSPAGHRMLSIFILAVVLWVTEAIPIHATAVLIILLQVLTLADRGLVALPEDFAGIRYQSIFAALADPIIILFLGGFVLADCAKKYELDKNLSRTILRPFGTRPHMVMLGLILITGIFSMFMSNTATTATMMTLALPVIMQFPAGDRMRAGLALSIPMAANIGGIGTPIGTPPNAIALGALVQREIPGAPTFLQWMLGAVPFMLIMLVIAWLLLIVLFRSGQKQVALPTGARFNRSTPAIIFYVTFALTVLLWMTEELHGLNANIVGFIPVVVLLSTSVFTVKDLKSLDWHVLWLVAGGIALGLGVGQTGLDRWIIGDPAAGRAGLMDFGAMSPAVLLAVLAALALVFSTFISNSATANLLVPIGISLALSPAMVEISPVATAIFIAFGCSLAMSLPISTPPNAVAYATGEIHTRNMAPLGALIGVIGWLIIVTVGPWFWRLVGILPA